MPAEAKKGITVKIDAALHAEVKQYLEEHDMTMAEFVTIALTNELHPKIQQKEGKDMEKMRTLAFQVPEDLFMRLKGYLQRNNLTQKDFVIGLIEGELEQELVESEHRENQKGIAEPEQASGETEEPVFAEEIEAVSKAAGDGSEEAEESSPVEATEAVSEAAGDGSEEVEESSPVEELEAVLEESGDSSEEAEAVLDEWEDQLEETENVALEEEYETDQEEDMDSEPEESEESEDEEEGMGLVMGM